MQGAEMNAVVEKVADKIGVAVEKLAPLANEVIRQYRLKSACYVAGLVVALLVVAILARWAWRFTEPDEAWKADEEVRCNIRAATGLVTLLSALLALGFIVHYLTRVIAPLPSLLGL